MLIHPLVAPDDLSTEEGCPAKSFPEESYPVLFALVTLLANNSPLSPPGVAFMVHTFCHILADILENSENREAVAHMVRDVKEFGLEATVEKMTTDLQADAKEKMETILKSSPLGELLLALNRATNPKTEPDKPGREPLH